MARIAKRHSVSPGQHRIEQEKQPSAAAHPLVERGIVCGAEPARLGDQEPIEPGKRVDLPPLPVRRGCQRIERRQFVTLLKRAPNPGRLSSALDHHRQAPSAQ